MHHSDAPSRRSRKSQAAVLAMAFGLAALGWWRMAPTAAFDERSVLLLNVGLPMVRAGVRAHRRGRRIAPAVLQAAFGGLMMRRAFEMAGRVEDKSAWQAWQAKLILNLGASLAESAGGDPGFRLDLGPLWLVSDGERLGWRLGLHATLAPILNYADGARINWGQTFRYGTVALERSRNPDGTIGSRGALAYSNANNFITNERGRHAGHELVHTFQYRRDAFLSPRLTRLVPALGDRLGPRWLDDTGWSVNWGAQCLWAGLTGRDRDFDIPMEKEAYLIADGVEF